MAEKTLVARSKMNQRIDIIVKTLIGLERIATSRIEEMGIECRVNPKPFGHPGVVTVELASEDRKHELAEKIREEIPEAERVLVAERCVKADLEAIAEAAVEISNKFLSEDTSFAVKTVRRGTHSFTSIDVNYRVGSAIVKAFGAPVNLEYPDVIFWVEIFNDVAALGVMDGKDVWRKAKPGKYEVREFFSKVAVVQMPYFGPKDSVKAMSSRIGRAVQMFEVNELVIATTGPSDARQLEWFIHGVFEGIESRYQIQKRTYAHKPHRVHVTVQDIYQLVRDRRNEPKIVFEPEGEAFPKVAGDIAKLFLSDAKRINMFFGSREGIPKGIFRFADFIVDLCPGVTLSTEYAASSALIGLAFALEDHLARLGKELKAWHM